MSLDIRDERGVIGQYNGNEVFVIPQNEFDKLSQVKRNIVYALVKPGKYESILVKNMVVMGHISPDGGVTEYDNPFDYLSASRSKAVDKPKPKPQKTEKPQASHKCTHTEQTEGFKATTADEFLHYVADDWDPIALAVGMWSLEVKPIATPTSVTSGKR